MRIVFIGFASSFTEGMDYQDNALCSQTLKDGHSVTYIGNAEKFDQGKVVATGYEDKILPSGLRLVRLPYQNFYLSILTKKIRKFQGVYKLLEEIKPDIIFCHNTQYWSILDVIRYKKEHTEVKLYADTHSAYYNSGTNWLSLHILHRIFYKYLVKKVLPYLDKYFYVGNEEKRFTKEVYGVPEDIMEFYPLGGILLSEKEYADRRERKRHELDVSQNESLLVHSGKLEAAKRTECLLKAFMQEPNLNAKLVIIGYIPEDQKHILNIISNDKRIQYLGWKNAEELSEYLCACDLYCQPGSVSATMQNAICNNCAVMSYPHQTYLPDLDFGNFIWVKTVEDIQTAFERISAGEIDLDKLKQNSKRCAAELLDYKLLAARLYI